MQDTQNRKTEDIQPVSITQLLWLFFDAAIKFIRHFILFLNRYKYLLSFFLLAGLITGFLLSRSHKATYKVSMMVKNTELNAWSFGQMLEILNSRIAESQGNQHYQLSGFPDNIRKHIIHISGENISGTRLTMDTSQQNNRTFLIEILLNEQVSPDTLQSALLSYFNNNPYLSTLKQNKIERQKERLQYISTELSRLDSLKQVYHRFYSSGKPNSLSLTNYEANPADLYKQSYDLLNEKTSIEEWLKESQKSLIVIDGTAPVAVPPSKSRLYYIALYGGIFLLLGCIIAFIRNVVRMSIVKR